MRLPFMAGNWKMHKTNQDALAFAEEFKTLYQGTDVKTAILAPFTDLKTLVEAFAGTSIKVGAQNVHFENSGAFTGEISAAMLQEIGVDYCIVGHSERRQYFGETDDTCNRKLHQLFTTHIIPILCVGEVLEERDQGLEKQVVETQVTKALEGLSAAQVAQLVIAYEPVWAIGTGRTATPQQANEMCGHIRQVVSTLYDDDVACALTIQYGGSMKPENATQIMAMEEIDGGLIGGASLVPTDFMKIIDF